MGEQKFIFWFNVIVGPLAGGFIAYWVAASVLSEYSWCIAGEEHCVREWMSALSGWAAFIGAAIALPYLASQANEAAKQSSFILGDAEPEFILQRNRPKKRIALMVRNWNRRRVMIDDIFVVEGAGISIDDFWDADRPHLPSHRQQLKNGESGSFGVNGWVDRSQEPPSRLLKISIGHESEGERSVDVFSTKITLTIHYRIVGQRHEKRASTVSTLTIADE